MGKAKSKKDSKSSSAAPKCTCDHPYTCQCGNRPPRPSKGHKWDPESQTWGGKGHKQKGASGQTASTVQQAQTTEVGKTRIEAWQRLPSKLLEDYCRKQKRPRPKYKQLDGAKYKYRVILPDPKDDSNKDLFFVPVAPVGNEEQAKEEACLLALLHVTPTLPHERQLPEPYKTTWLHAVEASKAQTTKPSKAKSSAKEQQVASTAAQASTSLTRHSNFASRAEREQAQQRARQKQNARNRPKLGQQNPPVLMGAALRQRIEKLLRGDTVVDWSETLLVDPAASDRQMEIEEHLQGQGFTAVQARRAYEANGDDLDGCFQWLLIHLDEHMLPADLDPRGGLLDVVVNKSTELTVHGLTLPEKAHVEAAAMRSGTPYEVALWKALYAAAAIDQPDATVAHSDENVEMLQEELEALDAIFPGECSKENDGCLRVSITVDDFVLVVGVEEGLYPSKLPCYILVSGNWPTAGIGVALHLALIRRLQDLHTGAPMIFDIHGTVVELVGALGELEPKVLKHHSQTGAPRKPAALRSKPAVRQSSKLLRPRDRHPFWSTAPGHTPVAEAHPRSSRTIEIIRKSLPAAAARNEFLQLFEQARKGGRVMLVTGDTGCGKTTQIPQFLLEQYPAELKVVVCQPRRLAATGVATRVSEERGEARPGIESVGYVVRGDSALSNKSRLVFCTTGVLLRQLQCKDSLANVNTIIIDEVHERNLDSDVLMGILKQRMHDFPSLSVILMSATLDADRFASYWGSTTPRMHIPGRTFPVRDFMLEDVLSLTGYMPPKRKGTPNASATGNSERIMEDVEMEEEAPVVEEDRDEVRNGLSVMDLVKRVDETTIDYKMLGLLVKRLIETNAAGDDGSVLVFLPGVPEINKALDSIKRMTMDMPVLLLPLHGGLQPKEQNLVFQKPPSGTTKVICSTNVAETSVTIADVTLVIDAAREKQSAYDPSSRMPLLVEQFCSKASMKQRRGRAGRVREGTCYKLISRTTFSRLPDHGDPEIKRCALEQTLLSLIFLGVERSSSGRFLQTLLDPPSTESLQAAIQCLTDLGALIVDGESVQLTPLGMHMAGIPAPPVVGKLLVMGAILGCRSPALAMAAGMSVGRSPLLQVRESESVHAARAQILETVGNSDHALLGYLYMQWVETSDRKSLCETYGLSWNGMRDMHQLVQQFDRVVPPGSDVHSHLWRVWRTCAVSALAPSQMLQVKLPPPKFLATAGGAQAATPEARELRFFRKSRERVWIHPSCASFGVGNYSCPWVVYGSLVRTSKPFVRDITEASAYALLMLAGSVELQRDSILVDGWCTLSAHPRIGSLVGGLRKRLDRWLEGTIRDPSMAAGPELELLVQLIASDGLGM